MKDRANKKLSFKRQPLQNPLVSIIVPIYNVEKYLSECLESLVGQSYANLDIILIDDGSSDKSLEIALNYASRDERIFVVAKQNGGLSSARNFGLEFIKDTNLRAFFEDKISRKISDKFKQNEKALNDSENLSEFSDKKSLNLSKNDRENEISQKNSTQNAENSHFKSLVQTHSFEKRGKFINESEIRSHFRQISSHFVKSDLCDINEIIIQNLPNDAFVVFVDSDDYLRADCIELCVNKMQENACELVVYGYEEFIENESKFKQGKNLSKLTKSCYDSGLSLLLENKFIDFHFAWQGLFRATLLNRYAIRFTHGIYHEDHDFGTLLFAVAGKVRYINENLLF